MPYVESNPYAINIAYHIIHKMTIDMLKNQHELTIGSYDSNNVLIKTDFIKMSIFDSNKNILLPSNWPVGYPTGSTIYGLLEAAFYGRLKEEAPWLIKEGTIQSF